MKKTVMRIFVIAFILASTLAYAKGGAEAGADGALSEAAAAFKNAGIPFTAGGVQPVDFTLPSLNGTNVVLSELAGKVVFLNFWATWCGPCQAEMPSMESLYQKLKDRGFVILAVNLGESNAQVSDFMRKYNLSFPTLLDRTSRVGTQYGAQAIPTTYIIDRRGLIVARMIGSINWDTPEIIAALETLLK
jgi:thiol-disulfide isomerase/thioredoxin